MVKPVEWGSIFLQLLELGYEKFPRNTTGPKVTLAPLSPRPPGSHLWSLLAHN